MNNSELVFWQEVKDDYNRHTPTIKSMVESSDFGEDANGYWWVEMAQAAPDDVNEWPQVVFCSVTHEDDAVPVRKYCPLR